MTTSEAEQSTLSAPHLVSRVVDCMICSEPASAIMCFPCGHFTCYVCGLRLLRMQQSCPVCRKPTKRESVLTVRVSVEEGQYSEEEVRFLKRSSTFDSKLQCYVDGQALAVEMKKLYLLVCPMESCWEHGQQQPFANEADLRDHMASAHQLEYCKVCLAHRPYYLSEQTLYSSAALQQHINGMCEKDAASFVGHPRCLFCKNHAAFLDADDLKQHMIERHFSCEFCPRESFALTFFRSREHMYEHYHRSHKVCTHSKCAENDILLRVFRDEFDLDVHNQREHRAKPTAYRPGAFGNESSTTQAAAAAAASSSSSSLALMANSADLSVLRITFDYIGSQRVLDFTPKSRVKSKPPRRGTEYKEGLIVTYIPPKMGLPEHFLSDDSLLRPLHRDAMLNDDEEAEEKEQNSSAVTRSRLQQQQQQQSDADGSPALFWSASSRLPNQRPAAATKRPDRKECEKRLNALLRQELPADSDYYTFVNETKQFIGSHIKTAEYVDTIQRTFRAEKVNDIVTAIIATCPEEEKRLALREVWRMRTAPELLRLEKARREDAKLEAKANHPRGGDAVRAAVQSYKEMSSNSHRSGLQSQQPGGAWGTGAIRGVGSSGTGHRPAGSGGGQQKNNMSGQVWANSSTRLQSSLTDAGGRSSTSVSSLTSPSPTQHHPHHYPTSVGGHRDPGITWVSPVSPSPSSHSTPNPAPGGSRKVNLNSDELFPSLPAEPIHARLKDHEKEKKKKGKATFNAWFDSKR